MKAVILAGGEGTRLRPLTCNITKAMMPILNKPFLEYLIRYLKGHDIRDIILTMGYLPHSIQGYFGDGAELGVHLTYLVEEQPLGTGGAVKNAEALLDESFFVVNGDILTGIDLTAMMSRHQKAKPVVSIALTPVDDPTVYGVVETDCGGMVKRFLEKPGREQVTTNMINAGIYILEPEVLRHIPPSVPSTFERHLFPLLLEKGEFILSYPSDAYWIDIGTPENYVKVQHDLLLNKAPCPSDYTAQVNKNCKIHPTAEIEGPVLIGEDCVIARGARIKGPAVLGPRCEVGEDATIEGAIQWHDSKVGRKAVLRNCIVASSCHMQEGCQVLDNCVLGDNVVVEKGSKLTRGVKVWPDKRIEEGTVYS